MTAETVSPLVRRNIRLLSAFSFCNDFRVYAPIIVIYFSQITGSLALATLLFSITKIASSVFEVPTGVFSDFLGRKLTIVLGQAASVASLTLFAFGGDFAWLAAGAVMEGLAFALFSGNNDAFLYDTLKSESIEAQFPEWQGRVSAMFQLALAVSAAVAAVALGWLSLRWMFVLTLPVAGAGVVFAALLDEPKRHSDAIPTNVFAHLREALAGFARDVRLRELSLASMLGFGLGEAKHMFQPVFFALFWPAWGLGVAGVAVHGLASLGFRIGGGVVRRFGELRVLVGGNFASIVIGAGAVLVPTVASPAIISLSSILFGPAMVAQSSLMQKAFTDAQRATMASLNSLGGNILFAIAVFLIGAVADRVGARFALLGAEILTIPVTLLYWRLYRSA